MIEEIKVQIWHAKIEAILNEKENNQPIINHRLVRNILIEVLRDMDKELSYVKKDHLDY